MMSELSLTGNTLISTSTPRAVNRRQFLKMSSATLIGGATLVACGGSPANSSVTLVTAKWPYEVMPSKADQQKDPLKKAYAENLQRWLDKNPGVTLKDSAIDIWDTQKLISSVSAGTAPTWYFGQVLGSWGDGPTRSAFVRGLAADVTKLNEQYNINEKSADYVKPSFSKWNIDGKFYGSPMSFITGNGIYYRRDLIKEAGLQEPTPKWTWEDFRQLAKGLTADKRKGAALQPWGLGWALSANGRGNNEQFMTLIPAPKTGWRWRYDFTSNRDKWKKVVDNYRGMYFTDKSVYSDAAWTDAEVAQSFARGDSAFMPNNDGFYLRPPSDPLAVIHLSTRLNKPIEEVVGFISHPVGTNGAFGNTQAQVLLISFNPRLNRDTTALNKAFDLYTYMTFDQGYIDGKVAVYNSKKDLQLVYDSATPVNGKLTIPGIPGTIEDAWGVKYVEAIKHNTEIPLVPLPAWYFPAEKNAGPPPDARNDALNALAFSERNIDEILDNAQRVTDQQLASLTSSLTPEEFKEGAEKYFAALTDFWQKESPTFYNGEYQTWYKNTIEPALKS